MKTASWRAFAIGMAITVLATTPPMFGQSIETGQARRAMVMDDIWIRFSSNMMERVSGPMKFRLVLQPVMATIFAIRSGLADAKAGKPPYLWSLASNPGSREEMLKDGWKSVGKVFVLALVLDVVYQIIELRFVYPGEAIAVASILAFVPYLILRGLATRLARRK